MSKGMKTFFDVGANDGTSLYQRFTHDLPDARLFLFEPNPDLCEVIKQRYDGISNWHLSAVAVSDFDGRATFNIAGRGDRGCSSLLNFHPAVKDTWNPARTDPTTGDLNFTHTIEARVITLDYFIRRMQDIHTIDYLHIDAQGSDLKVLQGLGEHIGMVKMGRMEAALNAPLYEGSPTAKECQDFLTLHGFHILAVQPDGDGSECDILFERP